MRRELRRVDVPIASRDYWYKALDNHQMNWALLDEGTLSQSWTAFFFHELSGVFDRLSFPSRDEAVRALTFNGFRRLAEDDDEFPLRPPPPPFYEDEHPNGPIYSSGRFWDAPPPRRLLLNSYDGEGAEAKWCWDDLDSGEASQEFESQEDALSAMREERLKWSRLEDLG